MLPEIGALEFLVIAAVALIVVGPKDLPMLMRRLGQFTARLRGMAAEFRASFDDMARQSELDDLRKEVEALRRGQFTDEKSADEAHMKDVFRDIEQGLQSGAVQFRPPLSVDYAEQQDLPPVARSEETPPAEPEAATAAEPAPKPARARKPRTTDAPQEGSKPVRARKTAAAPAEPGDAPAPRRRRTKDSPA